MVKRRKKYSVEFKEEAVRFLRESGLPRRKVAAKLEVPLSTLTQWVQATESAEPVPPTSGADGWASMGVLTLFSIRVERSPKPEVHLKID